MPVPGRGGGDAFPDEGDLGDAKERAEQDAKWLTEELKKKNFLEKPPGPGGPDGTIVVDPVSKTFMRVWNEINRR